MTPSELNAQDELFVTLLRSAQESHATVSIRPFGGVRIQGDLQVKGLEPGLAIHLGGLKRRDQVDPRGTAVAVTILVGEEVLTFRTQLLDPIIATEGDTLFPPVLRVAWPSQGIQIHRRRILRVATPDLEPREATVAYGAWKLQGQLLNLTETGMGLGLRERVAIGLHAHVEVTAVLPLPGGQPFQATGEVRHVEFVAEEAMPTRLGLVLGCMTDATREALRSFIQARRADRSEVLRHSL